MGYTKHNYYVHRACVFYLVFREIILKLCDIMATHPGKAAQWARLKPKCALQSKKKMKKLW